MREKTVGIIGGMGPNATVEFLRKLLMFTNANTDQEHIRFLLDNNPKIPNRHEAIKGSGESPGPMLAETAHNLQQAGADFIVMPCNTAHAFSNMIVEKLTIPFTNMVTLAVKAIERNPVKPEKVGILAASGCLHAGLYQAALDYYGYSYTYLEDADLQEFMRLIYTIKSGENRATLRSQMVSLAHLLVKKGATCLISGCTEVPLVLNADDLEVKLVDSTDVLARYTVSYAKNEIEVS